MADITMCTFEQCPKKDKCYRYTAEPSDWQSYWMMSKTDKEDAEWGYCRNFYERESK